MVVLLLVRHQWTVTVGPKPHEEAALGPAPNPGRLGGGARKKRAGVEPVPPSGPLAGVRRGFSVSRRVASRSVSNVGHRAATERRLSAGGRRAAPGQPVGHAGEDGSSGLLPSGGEQRAEPCVARPCEIPSWLTSSRRDGTCHCLVPAVAVSMACRSLAS